MERAFIVFESIRIGARDEQQDASVWLMSPDRSRLLAVVSDGVGGQSGGQLASRAVVDTVKDRWATCDEASLSDPPRLFNELVIECHERINHISSEADCRARATFVGLLIVGSKATWVHSGDSRLYYFAPEGSTLRTRDHSVVQVLFDRGKISEAEMGVHPDQGRLLQCLGGNEFELPDLDGTELKAGEATFVLATDGFWERLTVEEIQSLATCPRKRVQSRLDKLSDLAVLRGGDKADNLAVIVARSKPVGGGDPRGFLFRHIFLILLFLYGVALAVCLRYCSCYRFLRSLDQPIVSPVVDRLDDSLPDRQDEHPEKSSQVPATGDQGVLR